MPTAYDLGECRFFTTICFQWKKEFFLFHINKWWLEACYVLIFRYKANEHHARTQRKATFLRELFPRQGADCKLRGWKPIRWSFFLKENLFCLFVFCFLPSCHFNRLKLWSQMPVENELYWFIRSLRSICSQSERNCVVVNFRFSIEILINCFMLSTSPFPLVFFFFKIVVSLQSPKTTFF